MYALDERRRPLIIISLYGDTDAQEADQLKADVDVILERREPFALIYDISTASMPPRPLVQDMLDWNRTARARFQELYETHADDPVTFTAYYMGTPMLRGLLRFMLQMMPSVRSQLAVCTSLTEAVTLAENAMARAGIEVPVLEDQTSASA